MRKVRDGSGSDDIARQAARLVKSGLSNAPKRSAELEAALRRCCKNAEHAKAVVDHVFETCNVCPAPIELVEIAKAVAVPTYQPRRGLCGGCNDGWVQVFWLVPMHGGYPDSSKAERVPIENVIDIRKKLRGSTNQAIYDAVEKCQCQGGLGVPQPVEAPEPRSKRENWQDEQWYKLCEAHQAHTKFPKLSTEFALSDADRRDEILGIMHEKFALNRA